MANMLTSLWIAGAATLLLTVCCNHTCRNVQDEAFELWTEEWGRIYDDQSQSMKLLKQIADTWWLVSLVDNDYVNGNLFSVFNLPKANGTS